MQAVLLMEHWPCSLRCVSEIKTNADARRRPLSSHPQRPWGMTALAP